MWRLKIPRTTREVCGCFRCFNASRHQTVLKSIFTNSQHVVQRYSVRSPNLISLVNPQKHLYQTKEYRKINFRFTSQNIRQGFQNKEHVDIRFGRAFRTSAPHQAAPIIGPLLVKLSSPLSRLGFILIGRRFRKWWSKLPEDRKAQYLGMFAKSRNRLIAFLTGFVGLSGAYYFYHVEETPITGRKRFMILNNDQLHKVASIQWKTLDKNLEQLKLPVHHPLHMKVYDIVRRILNSNKSKEVAEINWEVNVIESDQVNAFVLGNGQIYVFTGILRAVSNEHELAGVIGHEISHAILNHSGELLSMTGFFNLYSLAVLAFLWAFIPTDGFAILASGVESIIEELIVNLPYSRKLEKEADEVGLLLAARACYDIRHVPSFWMRMDRSKKNEEMNTADMSWLSTHPSNANRIKWMEALLPDALHLRRQYGCPKLNEFYNVYHSMTRL